MKQPQIIQQKILDLTSLQHQIRRWRLLGKTVAFTNGCFDILHQGHIVEQGPPEQLRASEHPAVRVFLQTWFGKN